MSLANCIPDLLAQGKIRKADAEKADRAYKRHFEALRGSMGDEAAAAEATERALDELDYAAKLKKRQAGLQIMVQQRLDTQMDAAVAKGVGPHQQAVNTLRGVEIARERIENQSHASLHDFLDRHRRDLLGRPKDKTGLLDVVRELHGQETGNKVAKMLKDGVASTFERLRLAFNRNGGDIGTRSDFGLPHRYDPLKVRQVPFEEFRGDFLKELAPEKMIDPLSGGQFTPERLDEFLKAAYQNIRTNGMTELSGNGGLASKALANRRSDPRFFVFKDGDAWLRIADKYGDGNPFEAIMSHVHGMARDIAFMEKLGPNPTATWSRLVDRADRIVANSDATHVGVIKGTSASRSRADRMWRYMNGDLSVPVLAEGDGVIPSLKRKALAALHATRDVLSSALLGSAQITSLADINTNVATRKFNGLPAVRAGMGYLQHLNPLDPAHRQHAVYLLAGARDATRTLAGLSRWFGETNSPRWSQVLADDVLRVTGMNKFFEAGRGSFIEDYHRQLATERGLSYDQLPDVRQWAFERHGITPEDWDTIRSADVDRFRGGEYVDWNKIAERDPQVADKMVDMVLREARSAVLETDAESQSLARWGRPGTLAGEFSMNVVQFKSFPLALIMDQGRRIGQIAERKGPVAAARYGVSFLAGMWMMGALTLQLKEIAKGKSMRPTDNWDFWWNAFVQGGGAGVLGDLVGSVTQDRVGGLADYLGGPVVTAGDDLGKVAKSAFKTDEQTGERGVNFGRQSAWFARRYTPGTNIWYIRAALDRLLWDELEERADPNYADYYARLEQSAQKTGQHYLWHPGEGAHPSGGSLHGDEVPAE